MHLIQFALDDLGILYSSKFHNVDKYGGINDETYASYKFKLDDLEKVKDVCPEFYEYMKELNAANKGSTHSSNG